MRPGDILATTARPKSREGLGAVATSLSKLIQGTPYGHVGLYLGKGQMVEMLNDVGLQKGSVTALLEGRDVKVLRPQASPAQKLKAVERAERLDKKNATQVLQYDYPVLFDALATKLHLPAPKASTAEVAKRLRAGNLICSNLVTHAYAELPFATGHSKHLVLPGDIVRSDKVREVGSFMQPKTAELAHAHESAKGIAPSQLRAGEKVELEHTHDRAAARQIAIDHLHERPDYYGLLEELEKKPLTSKEAGRFNFLEALRQPLQKTPAELLELEYKNAPGVSRRLFDAARKELPEVTFDPTFHKQHGAMYLPAQDLVTAPFSEPHVLAHELGHAELQRSRVGKFLQDRVGGVRDLSQGAAAATPVIGYGVGAYSGATEEEGKPRTAPGLLAAGGLAAAHAPILGIEAGASLKGLRRLKDVGAAPSELGRGKLLGAWGTYAAAPAVSAALGVGGYLAGRDEGRAHRRAQAAKVKKASYKLDGEQKFRGLDVAIENAKGSTRKWKDKFGKETGQTKMHFAYGYIRMTKGTDGDHVDVYLGPDEQAESVFIVNQMRKPDFKTFDEQKVMLGFPDAAAAKAAYLKQYNDPGFFGSMKTMPFEEFKMKVLSKKNFGEKIAFAVSPGMLSGLQHAGVGAGIGALAGGVGGAMHASPDHRGRGIVRGALAGAGLGAAGGAGIAAIKGHGAQQLATLRGSAQEAEQAALGAHQNVKNIAQHGWGSEISHAAPAPSHVSTSAPTGAAPVNPMGATVRAPTAAVEKGTLAARPGMRSPATGNSTVAARVRPQPGAGASHTPLSTQAQAAMVPEAHGFRPTESPFQAGQGMVQGQEGVYRKVPRAEGGAAVHQGPVATAAPTAAPVAPGAVTPGFSNNYDLARQQASAAGSRAAGLGLAANTLEAQQGVMNQAINRAGLAGAAAGTGLMGYMAVPGEYGGVSRQQPGAMPAKVGEDATADRLDDLGIGILASPYIADLAAAGGKKLMLRGGRMGALGAELHGAAEGIGHYLHNPAVELGGLALVAPGVTHTLARGINKLRGVPQEPPSAAPPTPATLAAEKVGRLLAQTTTPGHEKVAINIGGIASRGLSAGANFMWKNRKPIAGLAAVGAVGAGLYGGKKVIDTAKDMATEHHEPARYVGVPPGMRSPTSV